MRHDRGIVVEFVGGAESEVVRVVDVVENVLHDVWVAVGYCEQHQETDRTSSGSG